MHFTYLALLVFSLAGLGLVDWKYRLAVFDQPARALATLAIGVAVFLGWDALGISLGIFFIGDNPYMTGVVLAPELPLEEVFFLTLLVYQTLLLWLWFVRRKIERQP
jgi:lycopene cyclase domain-containing protein